MSSTTEIFEGSSIPGLGQIKENSGFIKIDNCSDGFYKTGDGGVRQILSTGDKKVEFIIFEDRTIAYVKSLMGYPAYYPVPDVKIEKPLKAVLMDLDGTTVRSEEFWIWVIQLTTASLLGKPEFELEEADISFVSGHSVSEHLMHCVEKYCPDKTIEEARSFYFEHTHREMEAIMQGKGRKNAFTPSAGIKEFLLDLKSKSVKLGLVTSGLYEKAYPEILSAFETLGIGKPDGPLKRWALANPMTFMMQSLRRAFRFEKDHVELWVSFLPNRIRGCTRKSAELVWGWNSASVTTSWASKIQVRGSPPSGSPVLRR